MVFSSTFINTVGKIVLFYILLQAIEGGSTLIYFLYFGKLINNPINKIRIINKFLGVSVLLSDIAFSFFISQIVTETFGKNYSFK